MCFPWNNAFDGDKHKKHLGRMPSITKILEYPLSESGKLKKINPKSTKRLTWT